MYGTFTVNHSHLPSSFLSLHHFSAWLLFEAVLWPDGTKTSAELVPKAGGFSGAPSDLVHMETYAAEMESQPWKHMDLAIEDVDSSAIKPINILWLLSK